jgi:hypothetical protein
MNINISRFLIIIWLISWLIFNLNVNLLVFYIFLFILFYFHFVNLIISFLKKYLIYTSFDFIFIRF